MQLAPFNRRQFINQSAWALGATAIASMGCADDARGESAPRLAARLRPQAPWGLQIGDVTDQRAVIWSRADGPADFLVECSLDERFRQVRPLLIARALSQSDYTARVELFDLPDNSEIFVRARFASPDTRRTGEPLLGRFRTVPRRPRNVRFVWGGDTAGQGWGIDLEFGGMKIYESMRAVQPDFFIHNGDNIYADGPMTPEVKNAAGEVIWRNAYLDVVPEKLKVAETLQEFRAAYLYNRYDAHVRAFSAEVPQIWQWDDHEVTNNWSPSKALGDGYIEKSIQTLVGRGRQAFLEYAPMRPLTADAGGRVYRRIGYGPDLDVFVLDMRSYRGANGCNVEPLPGPATAFLGREQLDWLKGELGKSRATWKVIAADMPLGLVVGDGLAASGCRRRENSSNGDGPVLGREFEIAELLRFIKQRSINAVWLTADVHYAAAHYYDPSVATFQDFRPFWEFVAGPLHAGCLGPNALDNTFGPTVLFEKVPPREQANRGPSSGFQFFGQVDIDCRTKVLKVTLKDINGAEVYSQELTPNLTW